MSNAFAAVPAYASAFAFGLDSVTESATGLIPQLGKTTDGAYGLVPAVDMVSNALFGAESAVVAVDNRVAAAAPNIDSNIQTAFNNATQNVKAFAETETPVSSWAHNVADNVRTAMDNVATNVYDSLFSAGTNLTDWINETSGNFALWGVNVSRSMRETASNIAKNWGEALSTAWTNFKNFMVATGEKVSGFWSEHKATIITVGALAGLTVAGIALAPYTGGASLALPALAKGAVLPANQPFIAMLGDQKNGRNLEAPEGLIRQIFQEEMARMDYNGGGDIIIPLIIDDREFGRAVISGGKRELRRTQGGTVSGKLVFG